VNFVFVCIKCDKIRQATNVISEASSALKDMPFMIFFPILPFVMALLCFGYWIVGAALIYTCDTITVETVAEVANEGLATATAVAAVAGVDVSGNTTNSTAGVIAFNSDQSIVAYMFWYHLFGWLWINQLIAAISMTAMSGAFSFWYFNNENRESKKGLGLALWRALKRVLRYHMGSMIFGACIVALVQFARAVMAYVDKQTKPWQDKNKLLKLAFKVVHVCMWCFEKVVKFITRNAYIMIAMQGKSFCSSAKNAFMNILRNLFLIGVTNIVSVVLITLGKLVIVIGCAALTFIFLDSGFFGYKPFNTVESELIAGQELIGSPLLPAALTGALAWVVASMFFYVYQMGIDTLLMCFIEEKKQVEKALEVGREVEYVGPASLVKFMSGGKGGLMARAHEDEARRKKEKGGGAEGGAEKQAFAADDGGGGGGGGMETGSAP